jgi:hypothetical protein
MFAIRRSNNPVIADGIKNISSNILNIIFSFEFEIFFLFTRDFKIIIKNKIIMKE